MRAKKQSRWSYYVAVDEIFHAKWASRQLARLEVFKAAMDHFWPAPAGHPAKLIQVAGTSGKGSTCQFLQAGLTKYGKAGCYVKPHVFDFAERFVVDNKQVPYSEIVEIWEDDVRPYCVESALKGEEWAPDHFEASLLVALKIFEKRKVKWGVVETGMGGRYDPVTALDVVATVVTNVGQDHEEALGEEHWQRALEKGGVCRPGVPMFTGDADSRTVEILRGVCADVGAPFHQLSEKKVNELRKAASTVGKSAVSSLWDSEHQDKNAAVAAEVIQSLVENAKLEDVARAFLSAKFVGRFWEVEKGVYADVAHNPSKTKALSDELKAKFPGQKLVYVVGISGPRDPVAVLGPLVRQAKAVVVTSAGFKGQDPEKVYSRLRDAYPEVPMHLSPNPGTTLTVAKTLRSPGETILFTGSTYMIDQALNKDEKLRHLNASVGWRDVKQKQIAGVMSFAIPEKS